jgi:hypothetical protein
MSRHTLFVTGSIVLIHDNRKPQIFATYRSPVTSMKSGTIVALINRYIMLMGYEHETGTTN